MKRLSLALASAAALGAAPAFAQDAGETYDEDDLIPMELVSEDELIGAKVYWADGDSAGDIVDFRSDDGDVTSILVHEMAPEASLISRYRITGEDITGFSDDQRTVVLSLNEDAYEPDY